MKQPVCSVVILLKYAREISALKHLEMTKQMVKIISKDTTANKISHMAEIKHVSSPICEQLRLINQVVPQTPYNYVIGSP